MDKTGFVEASQLLGVEGLGYARKLDAGSHFSVSADLDAEVDVVGVEVDGGWQDGDATQVNLEDTVGDGDGLGFGPQIGTGTSYVVDTENDRVATVGHIGTVEVNELALEIYLVVDADGGVSSIGTREAK